MLLLVALAAALAAVSPRVTLAHSGQPVAPHDVWTAWQIDPLIVAGLSLLITGYIRGVRELWSRGGFGTGIGWVEVVAFTGAILALVVALISPIDALGGTLFSAHMGQHLLLTLVAAPLLVRSRPQLPLLWAWPFGIRLRLAATFRRPMVRRLVNIASIPAIVVGLHVGTLWAWHVPALYQLAIQHDIIHALEHVSFFGTAVLFWRVIILGRVRQPRSYGSGLLMLFVMMIQGGLLGALITFSSRPWYAVYTSQTSAWGLSPLEDQQLAGLLMWIPAGTVYLIAAALLFVTWIRSMDSHRSPVRPGMVAKPPPDSQTGQAAVQ